MGEAGRHSDTGLTLHRSVAAACLTLPALAPSPALPACSSSVEVIIGVDEYLIHAAAVVKYKLIYVREERKQ